MKGEENIMKQAVKKSLRIGDLAEKLSVEKFVIRFWEKEFNVKTDRTEGGQRSYSTHDLNQFKKIKSLLYDQGLTIAGAKKLLSSKTSLSGATKTVIELPEHQVTLLQKKLHELKVQLVRLYTLL